MAWILLDENKVVIRKQLDQEQGLIEASDDVVCGQIMQEDGSFVNPPPSLESIIKSYESAVQAHLNAVAIDAGYDSIVSAVTYAEEPAVPKFQAEGQAFRAWRSLCWAYCYEALEEVQDGERPQPSVEELISELPAIEIPE